ncbi:MAG: hypothetical protein GYA16_13470 [Spirochaetes bacterium]|nr:hypothetical protein [Spirochaetota bacterium]
MKQWYTITGINELYLSRKWFITHRSMFCDNDDCCLFLGGDLSDLDIKKIKSDISLLRNTGTYIVTEKVKQVLEAYCKEDCEFHRINDSELYYLEVKTVAEVHEEYHQFSSRFGTLNPCPQCGRHYSIIIGKALDFKNEQWHYLNIEKNYETNLCRSPIKLGDSLYASYMIFISEQVIQALKNAGCKGFYFWRCV